MYIVAQNYVWHISVLYLFILSVQKCNGCIFKKEIAFEINYLDFYGLSSWNLQDCLQILQISLSKSSSI